MTTPALRDARELVRPAVDETLEALDLSAKDAAAVKLARRYADAIDHAHDLAWAMRWLGPLLLDCLESLGATPSARSRIRSGEGERGPNRLTALRAAHR